MTKIRTAVALLIVGSATALAQDPWPTKSIQLIVPFAAGGSADVLGRLVADETGKLLGQTFVVENRTGAGGVTGTAVVAKAAPDGYTLLVSGSSQLIMGPATNANPGYDPIKSFSHIAYIGGPPTVFLVHPSFEARSVAQLLAEIKKQRDPMPYVSPGPNTTGNVVAEMWARRESIRLTHIPYKGASQAVTDLVAGHVKFGSITVTTALPHIRSGALIPLAISATRRLDDLPDVPTFGELSYPEIVATTWYAISAPAGVSDSIVTKLNTNIMRAMESPALQKRLKLEATATQAMTPLELTSFVAAEVKKWTPVARAAVSSNP